MVQVVVNPTTIRSGPRRPLTERVYCFTSLKYIHGESIFELCETFENDLDRRD